MSKHTQGLWHVANGCQIRSEKHQIARAWMMRNGEGMANARLIAAAPELLEALEYCLDCLGDEFALPADCQNNARAAIAKSRGEA